MGKSSLKAATWALVLTLTLAWSAAAFDRHITREPFVVNLGGFEAKGELTYPVEGEGPFPAVILVHGSGMTDMNHVVLAVNYMSGSASVLSNNFFDIAQYLSTHGYAVLRYNKRFVNGPSDGDFVRYSTEVTLRTLADDVNTVLEVAKEHPFIDADRLYLYGWSEGSTVAAQVAIENPSVAGLIVQTPVVLPWRENFEFQMYEVGVPYLRSIGPSGQIDDGSLFSILLGSGGMVAKSIANYIVDPEAAQSYQIRLNPMLDLDQDGALSIDEEIVPGLSYILDAAFSEMGFFNMYAPEKALPVLSEQVAHLKVPVLILQGENDANTPAYGAQQLAEALQTAGADVTFHLYEGLGHSLGHADSFVNDNFAPIDQQPLADTLAWLNNR